MRINDLPHWIFTDLQPAFNDTESLTAIEMVSRVYGKLQEIIDEYNKYVDEINNVIEGFITGSEQDQAEFEAKINKIMHDYIIMIDSKIKLQDETIDKAIEYMTTNLANSISNKVQEMIDTGLMTEVVLNGIEDIKNRLPELENNISTLENTIATNENTTNAILETLESSNITNERVINSLEDRVNTAEISIELLEAKVELAETELENVNTGLPNYVLKNDLVVVTGDVTLTNGSGQATVPYPDGFTKENSVVVTAGCVYLNGSSDYGYGFLQGTFGTGAVLGESVIVFMAHTFTEVGPSGTFPFKIVLMKI